MLEIITFQFLAKDVKRSISKQLSDCDIWTDNYTTVAEILTQCIAIGERWLKSCKQLTQIFWPNYSSNMWKEEMYEPPDLVKLVDRLREVSFYILGMVTHLGS